MEEGSLTELRYKGRPVGDWTRSEGHRAAEAAYRAVQHGSYDTAALVAEMFATDMRSVASVIETHQRGVKPSLG